MGIKFVVDLSPPEEGDEAVAMVEKLWCPDEVLSWKTNLEGYVEPDEEEEEDATSFPSPLPHPGDTSQEQDMEIEIAGIDATSHTSFQNFSTVPHHAPAPPSYSPTRHTAAIERVLHILHGLDPRIHTTPMWYTVHKVAVQLQCTSAVQDHILSWLYSNLDFVEHYPALVLRIAAEVQNQTLFRDAFALLVGAQLNSRCTGGAGASQAIIPDDKVPEEAEPWRKHILFARRSLQLRLKQLHDYMLSTAWLDNATAIPEYAKLVSRLNDPSLPPRLKTLTHDLDRAIRADLKSALTRLFAFSEGSTGLSHMPPRERQIYSRVYWLKTQRISQQTPLFGDHVVKLLLGWEGSARRIARETRERELGLDTQVEWISQFPETLEFPPRRVGDMETTPIHHQNVLEVREKHDYGYSKGKAKATFIAPDSIPQVSHRQTSNWHSATPDTQHPEAIDKLKKTFRPNPSYTHGNISPQSLALPSIRASSPSPFPSHSAMSQLPGLGNTNVPASLPPSYDDTDTTLPCCSEDPISETVLESSTHILSPFGVKRKSCGNSVPWLAGPSSSEKNAGGEKIYENLVEDVEMYEMTAARVLSRPERIEIINPISKRRRSVERCGSNGEENAEASLKMRVEEEPEVFRISGVYNALLLDHAQGVEDEDSQGQNTQVTRINREFQDAVDNVMTDARLVPADVAAYWGVESVRARQGQCGNGEEETTLLGTRILTEREAKFSVACLLDEPALYIPSVQPLKWRPSAKPKTAKTEESSNVQQTIEALGAFFGDTNTPPVTYHSFATPCPYTSIPESSTLSNTNQINTYVLWAQCVKYLKLLGADALEVPISFAPTLGGELFLVCLEDEEWQYMPLWAGGLDDGTGGVFGEFIAPPPPDRGEDITKIEPEDGRKREEEDTEVESLLGSYDDCMDVESMGSFETSGFSEFENSGSTADWSEFGDSEADEGQSDVEAREESEIEGLGESTTGEDDIRSDDEFEDFGWEST